MIDKLPPREQKGLIFLQAYMSHHGISPSYREIAVAIGTTSTSQVTYMVDALAARGLIKRGRNARTIELLPSENNHAADCVCGGCASARYLGRLKLVHALEITPPISARRLRGLRKLTLAMRADWLSRKGSKPCMKAVQ